jgi:hypothetical protein
MKNTLLFSFLLITFFSIAQVGIGTTNPKGMLDVTSTNMAFIAPRVTSIETVTDGSGGIVPNGAIVYDSLRDKTCYKIKDVWICTGFNGSGVVVTEEEDLLVNDNMTYIKASNTDASDYFGYSVSISNDGSRLAVGAYREDSNATGINGDETNNSASSSGAVYVFSRTGSTWVQEAYIKASNTGGNDYFGYSVSISNDGSRLAVGAYQEASNARGINGDETDNSKSSSGAVYVFNRTGTTWSQIKYIKASNTDASDYFGYSVSISGDTTYLSVGANNEASNATGINGNQTDNSKSSSGAVYVINPL